MKNLPNIEGYKIHSISSEEIIYTKDDIIYLPDNIIISMYRISNNTNDYAVKLYINPYQYILPIDDYYNIMTTHSPYYNLLQFEHNCKYKLVKCSRDDINYNSIICIANDKSNINNINNYGICIKNNKIVLIKEDGIQIKRISEIFPIAFYKVVKI